MSVMPDTDGFVAASLRLRGLFGDTITFHVPQEPVWPNGTRINPDTGEPYNAMLVASNPPFADVPITALVILREASPTRPQGDAQFVESGLMSGMDIILDVSDADYALVQGASEFTYTTRNYRVEEWKPFAMANVTYRHLCYGKER